MADDNKKSANEIGDDIAKETGGKEKNAPKKNADMMAGLGGIFDVAPTKNKQKEPHAAPSQEEAVMDTADTKEETPKLKSLDQSPEKKKKNTSAGVDGIFMPGNNHDDEAHLYGVGKDGYLGEDDLGDYEPKPRNGTTLVLVSIIAVLTLSLIAIVLSLTPYGKDILLVFKGEYREHKLAQKKRIEDEYKQKQLAGLERYGNLTIQGTPKWATIKLDGELQYGQISSGAWRDVQLVPGAANFANLKIKQKHTLEVSSPGFETKSFELTEGMWQGEKDNPRAISQYAYTATLTPLSMATKAEFDARMGSDLEHEFFGTVTINTSPMGAKITFNNTPLLNAKGDELKSPATFSSYWVKNEKGKLEERKVKVDTTRDNGHKIQLELEGQATMPKYTTQLNRPMWTCTQKTEAEIKKLKLKEDASPQLTCNYTYTLSFDFNALKSYITRRDHERARMKKENEEIRKKIIELKNGGPSMSAPPQK